MEQIENHKYIGFGETKYWDKRYEEENKDEVFDWLESYASLNSYLSPYLTNKDMKILIIGCGNAKFSEDLYDDGFENIVNNDISSVVIAKMKERNAIKRPKMEWLVMDVTDMSDLSSNSFDLIIDKSTIDCLSCGDQAVLKIAKMLKEN